MKRLRELRLSGNYTQEDLARMLNVSQQTIGRWETGKAEPNIAALRDIAVIFGTSVDDLLDMDKTAKITTTHYLPHVQEGADGFWGHLGLLLSGEVKTRWYPITLGEANRLGQNLGMWEQGELGWLAVPTLNNRMLLFAISSIKRIWLLDDAADQPNDDDWDISWDGYQGFSPEIYRALEVWFYQDIENEYEQEYSENLRQIVDGIIEDNQLDDGSVKKLVVDTHIHFSDGTSTSYEVEEEDLHDAVSSLELGASSAVLRMNGAGGNFESYFPIGALRLIDMPLLKYTEGWKQAMSEFEGEEN